MKRIYLITSLILFSVFQCLMAQDTLAPVWTRIHSSPVANGVAEAWTLGTDSSGNIYWGVNQDMPGFSQFRDAFIYKLDPDQNLIWTDTAVAGLYAQQGYNIKVTDSLVYAAGRTCDAIGTPSCDVLFWATDPITGETIWDFSWDQGFGYEEIDGISLEEDGILLTGWTAGDGTEMDVLIMKIDYEGNLMWYNTWGGTTAHDDHQDGHIVVDDSMIYISGLFRGSPLLGFDGQALLAKFDKSNGSLVDSLTYGRNDSWLNAENALGMTTDGTYLYVTGFTTTSPNNWDLFVAKFDKNLNEIWYDTWGGTEDAESARAIAVSPDNSLYIGGITKSFGAGDQDFVLLKYDLDGNQQWFKTWGGAGDDHTLDIHIHENHLYMTGKGDSFHPNGRFEAILLKIEIDGPSSIDQDISPQKPSYHLFPNPMGKDGARLEFENPHRFAYHFQLFDLSGRLLYQEKNIRKNAVKITAEGLSSGLYLFQLSSEKSLPIQGRLMVH